MVVPTYNERENIGPLVRDLLALGEEIDVWVADDGSPDGTAEAVREAIAAHPGRVDLLLRSEKAGRGAAVIAAFRKGLADPKRYDVLVEMDADFSHHPRELPKLLAKLEECDMVVGSRYVEGGGTSDWGTWRPLLSWLANRYVAVVAGVPIRDTTSGYRAYRREVLETIPFRRNSDDFVFDSQVLLQIVQFGFKLGDLPVPVLYHGDASSIQFSRSTRYALLTLWTLARWIAHRSRIMRCALFETVVSPER